MTCLGPIPQKSNFPLLRHEEPSYRRGQKRWVAQVDQYCSQIQGYCLNLTKSTAKNKINEFNSFHQLGFPKIKKRIEFLKRSARSDKAAISIRIAENLLDQTKEKFLTIEKECSSRSQNHTIPPAKTSQGISIKTALRVAGASIFGLVLGTAFNFGRSFSFFDGSLRGCMSFGLNTPLASLNQFRERIFKHPLSNPFFSLPIFGSGLISAIGAAFQNNGVESRSLFNSIKKLPLPFSETVVAPIISQARFMIFPVMFRYAINDSINEYLKPQGFKIDIAGHALFHTMYLMQLYGLLENIRKWNGDKVYSVVSTAAAAFSLIDIPWAYNTAANCHSIADIAAAICLTGLSHAAGALGTAVLKQVYSQ
jgi:hypothetical protein